MYTQEEKNIFFYVYANTHYFSSNFSNLDISFFLGYLYQISSSVHISENNTSCIFASKGWLLEFLYKFHA